MKKHKKLVFFILLIVVFGIYNLVWYIIIHSKYDKYTTNMNEFRPNISYVMQEDDGYLYNVKLPNYLSYTGNLCVSTEDGKHALLLWPKIFGAPEYGVQITTEDNTVLSIMVDSELNPIKDSDSEIITENFEILNLLLEKKEQYWDL